MNKELVEIVAVVDNERIVLPDRSFEEFVAAISAEPDKPSDKLLAAVAEYHRHEAVAQRRLTWQNGEAD